MGSPAEDLDAVLQVLRSRGLEADVVVVGPVTVQLRRTLPALPATQSTNERADDLAAYEQTLFRSARAPG